jgi:hypothetical protein
MSVRYAPVSLNELEVIAWCDASFANVAGAKDDDDVTLDSQAGYLIGLASPEAIKKGKGELSIVSWLSHKLKRKVRSTLAAETMSANEALEAADIFRAHLAEVRGGERLDRRRWHSLVKDVGVTLVTDSRSLYDFLHRQGSTPSEKRLRLDLEILRDEMDNGLSIRWVESSMQLADALTKAGVEVADYLRMVIQDSQFSIVEDSRVREALKQGIYKQKRRLMAETSGKKYRSRAARRNEYETVQKGNPVSEPDESTLPQRGGGDEAAAENSTAATAMCLTAVAIIATAGSWTPCRRLRGHGQETNTKTEGHDVDLGDPVRTDDESEIVQRSPRMHMPEPEMLQEEDQVPEPEMPDPEPRPAVAPAATMPPWNPPLEEQEWIQNRESLYPEHRGSFWLRRPEELCDHPIGAISTQGTNQFGPRRRCVQCGLVLARVHRRRMVMHAHAEGRHDLWP